MSGVVVGVDRSPAGDAALEWALAHAVRHGQPLTAVRAWTVQPYSFYSPVDQAPADGGSTGGSDAARAEQQLAEEALAQARTRVPGSDAVAARAVAAMGGSASALLETAAEADLLVVGSRGAGPLSRAALGSVSSSVLHHARCPVAVVPAPRDGQPGARPRVVVGVDHSESSSAALAWAVAEARVRGAVLEPVAVSELDVRTGTSADRATPELEASERRALAAAAAAAGADRGDPVQVEPQVLAGHASGQLLAFAEGADLLVLGSRGRGGFTSLLLGSTSSQCAEHATGPVVVVRGG